MKKIVSTLLSIAFAMCVSAQEAETLTEQTIKMSGGEEKLFYYGFAAGDKIVFSFSEINGKEIKEVGIIAYPETSIYSDFKTNKIENKTINVSKTGVYVFRLLNSAMVGRICKIQIQRIPTANSMNFNTQVLWKEQVDTTWNTYTKDVVVGYDTTYVDKTRKVLVNTTLTEEHLVTQKEHVHSTTTLAGYPYKNVVYVNLPVPKKTDYESQKVVSWVYRITVGDDGAEAWNKTLNSAIKAVPAASATSLFGGIPFVGSGLASIAAGTIKDLELPQTKKHVKFYLVKSQDANAFKGGYAFSYLHTGTIGATYRILKDEPHCKGNWAICLENTYTFDAIDVTVEATAVIEKKQYEDEAYTETIVTPVKEKQIFKDPIVKTVKVPCLKN